MDWRYFLETTDHTGLGNIISKEKNFQEIESQKSQKFCLIELFSKKSGFLRQFSNILRKISSITLKIAQN
jgi:hypothetical protein